MVMLEAKLNAGEGAGGGAVGSPNASEIVLAMISGLISITVGATLVRCSSKRKCSAAGSLGSP